MVVIIFSDRSVGGGVGLLVLVYVCGHGGGGGVCSGVVCGCKYLKQ